jgi:hypothetical protein
MDSVNLLLIGHDAAAQAFLDPLLSSLPLPVMFLDGAKPALPDGPVGTLVVRDVAEMTPSHQHQFLAWLTAESGSARIITISARSLYERVERRKFSERLYYRLNTVVVPLSPVNCVC